MNIKNKKKIIFSAIFFAVFFVNLVSAEYFGAPIDVSELKNNAEYSFFVKINLGEKYLSFYQNEPGFWIVLNSENCIPVGLPQNGPKLKTITGLQRSQTNADGGQFFNVELKITALNGGYFGIPNNELIVEFRPVNFLPVKVEVSYLPINFQDKNPPLEVQCLQNLDRDGQYDEIQFSEANQIRNNQIQLINSIIGSRKLSTADGIKILDVLVNKQQ